MPLNGLLLAVRQSRKYSITSEKYANFCYNKIVKGTYGFDRSITFCTTSGAANSLNWRSLISVNNIKNVVSEKVNNVVAGFQAAMFGLNPMVA